MNNPNQQILRGPWSILPGVLPEKMRQVDYAMLNPALYQALAEEKKKSEPRQFTIAQPQEQVYIGSPERIRWRNELREDDQIVNLVPVVGVITRNPTWWGWSGIEIRDNILRANQDPLVQAHLVYLNTPGGQSTALYDIHLAIKEARSLGIPVYGLIDGEACSLGCGVASMCDKVYYLNPNDRIGSVGVLWSFWGAKPGATDSDGNTYVEIYDEQSYDKNKSVRDAIEGDPTEALAELARIRTDLVSIIKSGRPAVIDEQLHGKVFRVDEVTGTLVDGQADLVTVATEAIAAYSPLNRPSSSHTPSTPQSQSNNPDNNPKTLKQMVFKHLCNCLGIESLAVDEEKGSYIQESQLQALEDFLSSQATQLTEAQNAKLASDNKVTELTTQLETANSTHATAIAEKEVIIATQKQELSTANTRIATLEEENNTLAGAAGAPPAVAQPENNNDADEDADPVASQSVIKPEMSQEERIAAIAEQKAKFGY